MSQSGARPNKETKTMQQLTDMSFDAASDVHAIPYRLHPLDVGFNLRAESIAVQIDRAEEVRVSYADRSGARRVVAGPLAEVVAWLRKVGYKVVISAPGEDDDWGDD